MLILHNCRDFVAFKLRKLVFHKVGDELTLIIAEFDLGHKFSHSDKLDEMEEIGLVIQLFLSLLVAFKALATPFIALILLHTAI